MDRRFLLVSSVVFCLGNVLGSIQDIPIGHMQPLGSHTEPSQVEERNDLPTAQEFWEKYAKVVKPVVFRGAAKSFPAFTKWTDEYLMETYGDVELRLEGKNQKKGKTPYGDKGLARDSMKNFISTYHDPNCTKYVISELPKPMYGDVLVPSFAACGSFGDHIVEVDLWMNGGGSASNLHKDAFHIINCLLNGTKQWRMIETKYEKDIYKVKEYGMVGGYSHIDPLNVDLLKYPNFAKVPWANITMHPGDCVFLPKSIYHHVRSYGTHNRAVSYLFSRFDDVKDVNFSNCPAKGSVPLNELEPDWQYSGTGVMSMGNFDLNFSTRPSLLSALNKKGRLSMERLTRDFMESGDTSLETIKEKQKTVLEILHPLKPEDIDERAIAAMNKTTLRRFAKLFDSVDPYNTYDYEYTVVGASDIGRVIANLIKRDSVLHKDAFISMYIDDLEGSPQKANEVFTGLGGSEKETLDIDMILKNFKNAVSKFEVVAAQPRDYKQLDFIKNKPPKKNDNPELNKKFAEILKERENEVGNEDTGEQNEDEDEGGYEGGYEGGEDDEDGQEEDGQEQDGQEEDGQEQDGREEDGQEQDGQEEDGQEQDGQEEDGLEESIDPNETEQQDEDTGNTEDPQTDNADTANLGSSDQKKNKNNEQPARDEL